MEPPIIVINDPDEAYAELARKALEGFEENGLGALVLFELPNGERSVFFVSLEAMKKIGAPVSQVDRELMDAIASNNPAQHMVIAAASKEGYVTHFWTQPIDDPSVSSRPIPTLHF